jgi:hypothetical protein
LFFRVYTYCFGVLDDKERQFLTKIIEHLHMSNRIKALSYLKRIMRFVKQFFLKKKEVVEYVEHNVAQSIIKNSVNTLIKKIFKVNILRMIFLKIGFNKTVIAMLLLILI